MIHVPPVAVTDSRGGATKYPALGSPLEIVLGAAKVRRLNLIWHRQQQLASGGGQWLHGNISAIAPAARV